jgi:hypothetical protein
MRSCLRRDSLDLFRYDVLERITTLILNVTYMVASSAKGLLQPALIEACDDAYNSAAAFKEFIEPNTSRVEALADPTFPVVPDAVDQIVEWTDACFDTVDNMWVCSAIAIDCIHIVEVDGRPGTITGCDVNPTRPGPSTLVPRSWIVPPPTSSRRHRRASGSGPRPPQVHLFWHWVQSRVGIARRRKSATR